MRACVRAGGLRARFSRAVVGRLAAVDAGGRAAPLGDRGDGAALRAPGRRAGRGRDGARAVRRRPAARRLHPALRLGRRRPVRDRRPAARQRAHGRRRYAACAYARQTVSPRA